MSSRTMAIVVTYEPDVEKLSRLVGRLLPQVARVILVDNASSNRKWVEMLHCGNVEVILNDANLGVAAALNQGLRHCMAAGDVEFASLFDQDSFPSVDMIDRLEAHYDALSKGGPVAQVGAYFYERNRDVYLPFIAFHRGWPRRQLDHGGERVVRADYLITSGSLASLDAMKHVGLLDEALFIDYVDIEWGMRAKAKGFASFGAFDVRMEHEIGERPINVMGMKFSMHRPIRRYYYYRNGFLLLRRGYMPLAWKVFELARLSVKFFIFSLFSPNRSEDRKMMIRGIVDGVLNRGGSLSRR